MLPLTSPGSQLPPARHENVAGSLAAMACGLAQPGERRRLNAQKNRNL